jgi:hypothetical protein
MTGPSGNLGNRKRAGSEEVKHLSIFIGCLLILATACYSLWLVSMLFALGPPDWVFFGVDLALDSVAVIGGIFLIRYGLKV